jgi:hypothetical protein
MVIATALITKNVKYVLVPVNDVAQADWQSQTGIKNTCTK